MFVRRNLSNLKYRKFVSYFSSLSSNDYIIKDVKTYIPTTYKPPIFWNGQDITDYGLGTTIVEITLNNGVKGFGISPTGISGCAITNKIFKNILIGQSIKNTEYLWNELYHNILSFGRQGVAIQALSGVDLAIYDTLGKYYKEPVFNLIGGLCNQELDIYMTTDNIDGCIRHKCNKFKTHLPSLPDFSDNNTWRLSIHKNLTHLKRCINKLERHFGKKNFLFMVECNHIKDKLYALKLLNAIQLDSKLARNIYFVEQLLDFDDEFQYKTLKNNSNGLLPFFATGEHEYTKYGVRELITSNNIDILQPDLRWIGGISEANKVKILCDTFNIKLIPHAGMVYSYHLIASSYHSNLCEFWVRNSNSQNLESLFGDLVIGEPLPIEGKILLDTNVVGFGIQLNPEIELTEIVWT